MHIADIEYSCGGLRLVGQIAVDDGRAGKRPAVLVSHEGNGLGDHTKRVARKLAELGDVALALDYYGDGKPLPADQIAARCGNPAADGSHPALAYEPMADARSWRAMLDLFTEKFGERFG